MIPNRHGAVSASKSPSPATCRTTKNSASPSADLLAHGRKLFTANWTEQEGGGRPLTKGNGRALSDPASPLAGPHAFGIGAAFPSHPVIYRK